MTTIGRTSPHAAHLRQASTDAEQRLWYHLHNRQLGGYKFRRQVTIGRFIVDFACVECKLIVELGGGQHTADRDHRRTTYLTGLGWTLLRFWNDEMLRQTDAAVGAILLACQKEEGSALTLSSPAGGRGDKTFVPISGDGT